MIVLMKTVKCFAAILCLAASLVTPALAQELSWVRQINGTYANAGIAAAMDRDGNAYTVIRGSGLMDVSGRKFYRAVSR